MSTEEGRHGIRPFSVQLAIYSSHLRLVPASSSFMQYMAKPCFPIITWATRQPKEYTSIDVLQMLFVIFSGD